MLEILMSKLKNWQVTQERQKPPGIHKVFSILKAGPHQSHRFLLSYMCLKSVSNWQNGGKVHMLFHAFCCLYRAILVDSTQMQWTRSSRPPLELFLKKTKNKENPCVSFIQQFGVNVVFGQHFPENHLIPQVSSKSRYTTRVPAGWPHSVWSPRLVQDMYSISFWTLGRWEDTHR